MEEKDIKDLWKKGDELDSENYSQDEVEKIIQLKPKDIVSKFIKAVKIEQWLNLITLSILSIYLIYLQDWISAFGVAVLNVFLFIYYKNLILKLSRESLDVDVAQYLCDVYKSIKRFILHYKVLLWVITVPAYIFGIYYSNPEKFSKIDDNMTVKVILILVAGLVISIGLAHTVLYFMYGKKANKIKKMVEALKKKEIINAQ